MIKQWLGFVMGWTLFIPSVIIYNTGLVILCVKLKPWFFCGEILEICHIHTLSWGYISGYVFTHKYGTRDRWCYVSVSKVVLFLGCRYHNVSMLLQRLCTYGNTKRVWKYILSTQLLKFSPDCSKVALCCHYCLCLVLCIFYPQRLLDIHNVWDYTI